MGPIRIGIAGVGKIARDRHIPSIRPNPSFEIKAACSREGRIPGVANFASIDPGINAISILTKLIHEPLFALTATINVPRNCEVVLAVNGAPLLPPAGNLDGEYPAVYRRFADLVARREIDLDARPLQLVADIFLIAKRVSVDSSAERAQ